MRIRVNYYGQRFSQKDVSDGVWWKRGNRFEEFTRLGPFPPEKKERWNMSLKVQDWPEDKNDTPCWIGFEVGNIEGERERRIEITDEEARAGYWLLLGWDVGFLAKGVADPASVKWIDAVGGKTDGD